MNKIIDLRSDTLTKPTKDMRWAMYNAEVGDDGRITANGKGEDPTVQKLEKLAAKVTGKEDALFCCSGTMANIISLVTYCDKGDLVALGETSHIYISERSLFMEKYFGLEAGFYNSNQFGIPKVEAISKMVNDNKFKILCLENANSYYGGTCITKEQMNEICTVARINNLFIHLDGARIFNVAAHLNLPVSDLVYPVDTIMFCLSKGLGAPLGSMLCGSKAFIKEARKVRKLIGGGMRQAGIVAAAGIVAIQNHTCQVAKDNEHAILFANSLEYNSKFILKKETVQTNIVMLDIAPSGYPSSFFGTELARKGLRVKCISDTLIRLTFYRDITKADVIRASDIMNEFFKKLSIPKKDKGK